tara:strand:- start:176 stop:730 length:555 start_codon:yes stop_codon:yes gene_type:complete
MNKNFIHFIKGAYPKSSCKKLIKWFEDNKNLSKPGGFGRGKILDNLEICLELKTLQDFFNLGSALRESINNFIKQYPLVNECIGRWKLDPFVQLMKYEPNQHYSKIHCENDGATKEGRMRVFAFTIFLNNIKTGGGTEFVHQKFVAKPVAGDFYIWPAHWTHLHKGVNAPKEKKYIITGWCVYE